MPTFPLSTQPTREVPWYGLWVLVLLTELSCVVCCPPKCSCEVAGSLWCIKTGLSAIPQRIPPKTSSIYAFENAIVTLRSEDFAGLQELRLLHLSHNKISRLPQLVFQPLTLLSNLDLSSNQLTEIANDTFAGLRDLERLYLQRNRIAHIQAAAFQGLVRLVELKLQDNQLHRIPPLQLPTLLLLDLSRNSIPAAQLSSISVPELESLGLAGLGLGTIDEGMFKGMGSLQELDLSDNQLVGVLAALQDLGGLTSLSLRGNNQISHLRSHDFQHLRALQKLDVSGLSLTTIPQGFLDLFPKLRSLAAAENPYNCVCQLGWLVMWARANTPLLQRHAETRCHFPPALSGRPLVGLSLGDMGCPTTSSPVGRTTIPWHPATTGIGPTLGTGPTMAPGRSSPFGGRVTSGATETTGIERERPCLSTDCLNGGTCQTDRSGHRVCQCQAGFHGALCQMGNNVLDLQSPDKRLVNISHITSTSVTLELAGFRLAPAYYKGLRLTYRNWSGPDPRPVSLNIPTSLQAYSIRGLRPNSTYQLCVGALGESEAREGPCTVVQTMPAAQLAPFVHDMAPGLSGILWPALAGTLLIALLATTALCYYRRKRIKKSSTPGQDLEGIRPCLQEGPIPPDESKEAECLALQSGLPLIQEPESNGPIAL
ncbi:vasorin b [Rhinoraja longicauda]